MRPRLLLSNDDGLDSPFLEPFATELSRTADVMIVVPSREQSWVGRAYSRHSEIETARVDFHGLDCRTVSGTPSDCVNIALGHFCDAPPDAVISGLNIGQNIAMPLIWSSGTFAAAVEGAGWGFPAFAFSMRLEKQYYEFCRLRHGAAPEPLRESVVSAGAHAAEFISEMLAKKSPKKGSVLNVNYPVKYSPHTPFKKCVPAHAELKSVYARNGRGTFTFSYSLGETASPGGDPTDIECLDASCACYSEIKIRGS